MPRPLTSEVALVKNMASNSPVELYLLFFDSGTLYLTDCQEPVEFFDEEGSPQTYQPWGVSRGEITTSSQTRSNHVNISFDNVGRTFSDIVAAEETRRKKIFIWQVFLEQLNNFAGRVFKFGGYLDGPSIDEKTFDVTAYEMLDMYEVRVPRRTFQLTCPWVFGGVECGVTAPTASGTVDSSGEGNYTLYSTALEQPVGTWVNGFITIEGQGRQVVASESGQVTVTIPFFTDPATKTFNIKAGCDKTIADCEKWENEQFYGGFLYVPESRRRR